MKRALVRVNGGIEKGQRGRWSGSMGGHGEGSGQTGAWLWVRQEVVSSTLQGCKLYLAGLQALGL